MKRSFFVLALALTRHFMKPRYPIVALVVVMALAAAGAQQLQVAQNAQLAVLSSIKPAAPCRE